MIKKEEEKEEEGDEEEYHFLSPIQNYMNFYIFISGFASMHYTKPIPFLMKHKLKHVPLYKILFSQYLGSWASKLLNSCPYPPW